MINDRLIKLSIGNSRRSTNWQPAQMLVSAFYEKLRTPFRSSETFAEYMAMKKGQQDDLKDVHGGFVGGVLNGPRRKANNVTGRDLICLDADTIPAGDTGDILKRVGGMGVNAVVYSTRKHHGAAPRLRIIFPTNRTLTSDEYEPCARKMAKYIDPTMAIFDPSTFEASRLMFWASCCSDGEYVFEVYDSLFVNADSLLGQYADWHDASQWPRVPTEDKKILKELKAQQDPTSKKGIVGTFCRLYDIYRAMDEHLPGIYESVDNSNDRYTYMSGSTTGGAVVYDSGKFLYSHHSTDPCGGKLVNAFDLVRYHKFSLLDDEAKPETPMSSLPSYTRMVQYVQNLPEVQELFEKELGGAPEDFYGVGNVSAESLINPLSDKKRYSFNDMGNGFLFADLTANILRYCPQARGWYVYSGGKWQQDTGDAIAREYAKRMSDYLFHFVSGATIEERDAYVKNARQLYGLSARDRMLRDSQSVNPLRLEDLDTNTDLFNVQNGTLNLITGVFSEHSASDMISKKAGAFYVPGTDCPLWRKTLDEIFEGRADLIRYLQKVLGYALLGKPTEKQFYLLLGEFTNNGKSLLTQVLERLFGNYALNAPPELIAEKRFKDSSKPSGDRARLAGVRFVSINEPERGMRVDEAYVKALTGRDTQTARHLQQSEFQYEVQFILFISTNHLPYISDQTLFRSGRVRVIPIERSFTEDEQDKTLGDRLRQPQELSGILNWVLEGLAAYRYEGLRMPTEVKAAVDKYRLKSDDISRFMEEWTETDTNGAVQTSMLYNAFSSWCTAENIFTMSLKSFSQALSERGYKVKQMRYNGSNPTGHVTGLKCTFSSV